MFVKRWYHRFIKPMPYESRQEVIDEIMNAASGSFDFYLLVVLSSSIATLGLITNSAAVIIGAMLLAPLMSPIIAIGLASATGRTGMLRSSVLTLLKGALLAVLLALLITLINSRLPIISIQQIPDEVLARTRPTPLDMLIALAGGLAAAYALTRPNLSAALPGVAIATALMPPLCTIGIGMALGDLSISLGALLLFITNTLAIAFAAVFVFFLRGFSPVKWNGDYRLPGGLILSATFSILLLIPLTYYSVTFFQQAAQNRQINNVVSDEVAALKTAELVGVKVEHNGPAIDMSITIRTSSPLSYAQVVELQETLVQRINRPVSVKINQIFTEVLDPLNPPTATLTRTLTFTPTPGHSQTATRRPAITPSPTPAWGRAVRNSMPQMMIYQTPGGPTIGVIRPGAPLLLLDAVEIYQGMVWQNVTDVDGRIGWVPQIYIEQVTPTATATLSAGG